jgi:ribosomal protein S15
MFIACPGKVPWGKINRPGEGKKWGSFAARMAIWAGLFFAIRAGYLPYLCRHKNIIGKNSDDFLNKIKDASNKRKNKQAILTLNLVVTAANTGSIEGQIAQLTERISQISGHLQENKKDFSTHRGLMQLVGKRKRC